MTTGISIKKKINQLNLEITTKNGDLYFQQILVPCKNRISGDVKVSELIV